MQNLRSVSVTLLLLCLVSFGIQVEFDYSNQQNWGELCQSGENQSPINIMTNKVKYCPNWGYEKITFACEEFTEMIDDSHDDYRLNNIGEAFIFYYNQQQKWYQAYEATYLKWHTKSEHKINGAYADAELQIFFEPRKWDQIPDEAKGKYGDADLSEARDDAQTLGSVGSSMRFLFKLDDSAEKDIFSGLRTDGQGNTIWNLNTMLGCALDKYFYIYQGSRTVPTPQKECQQMVWTYVSKDMFPITQSSLDAINQKITYETNNVRQIQDLNGRLVHLTGRPCYADQEEI